MHRRVEGVGLDHLDITVLGDVVGNMDGVTVGVSLVYVHYLKHKLMYRVVPQGRAQAVKNYQTTKNNQEEQEKKATKTYFPCWLV